MAAEAGSCRRSCPGSWASAAASAKAEGPGSEYAAKREDQREPCRPPEKRIGERVLEIGDADETAEIEQIAVMHGLNGGKGDRVGVDDGHQHDGGR